MILCVAVALGGFLGLNAQSKSLDAGVAAYEKGDYKGAIAELDKALADQGALKEKALAKASYYRAQAQITYVIKAEPNLPDEMAPTIRQYSLRAAEDLKRARQNDTDGKMAGEIAAGEKRLQEMLIDLGQKAEQRLKNDLPKDQRKQAYQDMVDYASPVIDLDKYAYLAYDLKGEGLLGLGDSAQALKNFRLADDWFFRSAPKNGDMAIVYTYMRIAELEWYMNHNYAEAVKALDEGRQRLDGESQKIQMFGHGSPAQKSYQSERHQIMITDLDNVRMTLKSAAGK